MWCVDPFLLLRLNHIGQLLMYVYYSNKGTLEELNPSELHIQKCTVVFKRKAQVHDLFNVPRGCHGRPSFFGHVFTLNP